MSERSLLIVADDLGLSPEINEGILEVAQAGRVTVVAAMVNPPFHVDFSPFLKASASIGVHLNLTHGRPCLDPKEVPSLVDTDGVFWGNREQLLANMWPDHAEKEMRCQIDRFCRLTDRVPEHITFHKNLHVHHRALLDMAVVLARSLGASLRACDHSMRDLCRGQEAMTADHFIGAVRPAPFWTIDRLSGELSAVPPGLTEMMCHPGRDVKPVQGHWYIEQRDVERKTLLSDEAGEILSGFQLVNSHSTFRHHGLKKTLHS